MSPVVTRGQRAQDERISNKLDTESTDEYTGEQEDPLTGTSSATRNNMATSTTTVSKLPSEKLKLTYTFPRLNKQNFFDWKPKTEILFKLQGVWSIVNDTKTRPGETKDQKGATDWDGRNDIALAIYRGSIEDSEYRAVQSIKKSADAWKRLCDTYEPEGEQDFYRIFTKIISLKLTGGTKVLEFSFELEDLWGQLELQCSSRYITSWPWPRLPTTSFICWETPWR